MSEHIISPPFQPHYKRILCCLRPFQGRASAVRTRRQTAVVSSDAFQISEPTADTQVRADTRT